MDYASGNLEKAVKNAAGLYLTSQGRNSLSIIARKHSLYSLRDRWKWPNIQQRAGWETSLGHCYQLSLCIHAAAYVLSSHSMTIMRPVDMGYRGWMSSKRSLIRIFFRPWSVNQTPRRRMRLFSPSFAQRASSLPFTGIAVEMNWAPPLS